MLLAWCGAGFAPDAFWIQTPATFQMAMAGARQHQRALGERDIALAHTTARFMRADPLDPLARYLPRLRQPQGSMRERLRAIAARTGADRGAGPS